MPTEVRGALEPAGLAGFAETVLPSWRGDHMARAGQTKVARRTAILDDEHQGKDQNRSYEHAAHAVNIGICGICLKSYEGRRPPRS